MDVETRLLMIQHLNRTALRTLAGDAGSLPPETKKRIFAAVENLVWELPEDVFAASGPVDEAWAARAAEDPRVREPFDAVVADLRTGAPEE